MKIAMASPYYTPHIGGVEVHTRNLVEGLRKRGYDVTSISSTGSDIVIPCINIPYCPIPISFPDVSADVYHSHVPSPFFAIRLAKLALHYKKPYIVTYHNDVVVPSKVNGYTIPLLFGRKIEEMNASLVKPVLEKADTIIATTHSYAETSPLLSEFIQKIRIVPNAVNLGEFTPGKIAGEREPVVLYVGRLVEYKGLSLLIRAMADVQKEIKARLVVVGEGEDRRVFEELAAKLGVNAMFTGRISKKEVVNWMRRARTLVLPSFSRLEAFGIVLLEAMACSTPVMAANVPGVSEVASGGGFAFSDRKELVEKLKLLLTDDKLATKLGRMGRKAVEIKYTWEIVVSRVEKIYGELL